MRGCVKDDPPPSTTRRVATRAEAEFHNRPDEESRREQPGTGATKAANHWAASSTGSWQSCNSGTPAKSQPGRTRCRRPSPCPTSGGRIGGAWRGQPRQDQYRVLLVGERLDPTLKFTQRSRRYKPDALAASIGSLERLRALQHRWTSRIQRRRSGDTEPRLQSCSTSEWRSTRRRRVVARRLGSCPRQCWNWPHCTLEQQDHAVRQT